MSFYCVNPVVDSVRWVFNSEIVAPVDTLPVCWGWWKSRGWEAASIEQFSVKKICFGSWTQQFLFCRLFSRAHFPSCRDGGLLRSQCSEGLFFFFSFALLLTWLATAPSHSEALALAVKDFVHGISQKCSHDRGKKKPKKTKTSTLCLVPWVDTFISFSLSLASTD